METFRTVMIFIGTIPFLGIALYTIISGFYILPALFEAICFGNDAIKENPIPKKLRRFGFFRMLTFCGWFAICIASEVCIMILEELTK